MARAKVTTLTTEELAALAAQVIRQAQAQPAKHLTTEELAERMGVSVRTVQGWRARNYGPPFLPGRGRASALYRVADVEAWEKSRLITPGAA